MQCIFSSMHYIERIVQWTLEIHQFSLSGHLQNILLPLQWRHYDSDGVLNHQPRDCLLNRLFKAQMNENIKAPRHWPLWGEFTVDQWIPRKNGQ